MTTGDYRIRKMTRAELDLAIDWAAAEGWNPGLADADCFHASDPDGFLVGTLEGEPIASISVIAYDAAYGFLGFYIVPEPHRGKGYGLAIWEAGMAYLGDRVVGLDGVVAQQHNYRKSGFDLAHRNIRYGGTVALPDLEPNAGLADIATLPRTRLLEYDRPFFAASRHRFLTCWLRPDRRRGLALVRDGAIAGYGVIRDCREGYKIGPLFADDVAGADTLFRGLVAAVGNGPVYLDPPEVNAEAVALAKRYGLQPAFETARMYRGPAPALPLDRTFGITTFELG